MDPLAARHRRLTTAAAYLPWFVTTALAGLLLLVVRNAYLVVMGLAGTRPELWRLLDKVFAVVGALAFIVLVGVSEAYLVRGLKRQRLLRSFARIAGYESPVLFACHLLFVILGGVVRAGILDVGLLLLEGVAAGSLLTFSYAPRRD